MKDWISALQSIACEMNRREPSGDRDNKPFTPRCIQTNSGPISFISDTRVFLGANGTHAAPSREAAFPTDSQIVSFLERKDATVIGTTTRGELLSLSPPDAEGEHFCQISDQFLNAALFRTIAEQLPDEEITILCDPPCLKGPGKFIFRGNEWVAMWMPLKEKPVLTIPVFNFVPRAI